VRIVWSPLAIERIREAAEYIAQDKPGASARWAAGAIAAVERLGKMARSGRMVPEIGRPDVREILYGEYRILYRVLDRAVYVLTVRHGRRILDETETSGP